MADSKFNPTNSASGEKEVKSPNLLERAKEEFEAIIHHKKSDSHHKETNGLKTNNNSKENPSLDDFRAPNVFERAKEEFEAIAQVLHHKKDSPTHDKRDETKVTESKNKQKIPGSPQGVGWNMEKNTVEAPDDWWEKKKLENAQYDKFRTKGLSFRAEIEELFSHVAATGPNAWAPSSMTLPTEHTTGDDNDEPTDLEEGSGDSDEVLLAPTGISGDINRMTFNTSQGTSGEGSVQGKEPMSGSVSLGVRKRRGGMKKKNKGPASTRIADLLSQIVDLTKAEVEHAHKRADEASANVPSITEVMKHLTQLDEVLADDDWYVRCTKLMLDPAMREMYAAQMGMKKQLLLFLRHYCYGD